MQEILINKQILIVDDDEDIRYLLRVSLEKFECIVLEACNAQEAFEFFLSWQVDAIISDVRMPDGDGIELLNKVKEKNPYVPFMLLVTAAEDISLTDAYHQGVEMIFSKPFAIDKIVKSLARALTPPKDLWVQKNPRFATNFQIVLSIPQLEVEINSRVINIGRGGMFVQLQKDIPQESTVVEFKVNIENADIQVLSGIGLVRWAREESTQTAPSGCGIEFVELDEECLSKILNFIETHPQIPFIPKSL